MLNPHISYEELLKIVSWGIFSMDMVGGVQVKNVDGKLERCRSKNIKNAMHLGVYIGSPGKDIYMMLPYLNNDQMGKVAVKLSDHFPKAPPRNYGNVAACVRFIYGQFEKQGILRSKKDFKRMKKEKIDWLLPRKFLKLLYKELEKKKNYYGMTMLCEMEAHRLGDESILNNSKKKLEEMEKMYLMTIKYAFECKSYKHLFSMYYWASEYFREFGKTEKAVEYCKISIKNASKYYRKYFYNGEGYYSKRFRKSYQYIRENIGEEEWHTFEKKYRDRVKNKFKE